MKNSFFESLSKNKKGDLSINLLVMLVLLICVSSIFMFLTNNKKVDVIINGVSLETNSIFEKTFVESYSYVIAERVVLEAYDGIVIINGYLGNPAGDPLQPNFERVSLDINEKISEAVYENFKGYFVRVKEGDDRLYLKLLRDLVLDSSKFITFRLVN